MNNIILFLLFILLPALVLKLCNNVKVFAKLGPVLTLYLLGVLIGNIPGLNVGTYSMKETLTSVLIPVALPMMLFACSFTMKDLKGISKSLIAGLVAVIVSILIGYLIFGNKLGEDGAKIVALLAGCETGGTVNMASLQAAFGVDSATFVLLNSYDMIICFAYLLFLMSFGIRWFRAILGRSKDDERSPKERRKERRDERNAAVAAKLAASNPNPYKGLLTRNGISQLLRTLLAVIICLLVSVGIVVIANGVITLVNGQAVGLNTITDAFGKGWFMPLFILAMSTAALIAAGMKPIKKLTYSYDLGMYLIYIFSITVASMADVTQLNLNEGLYTILFLFFLIFISLFIQLLLSKLMKIDADTMVITSVALINSPPFVPMVASAMQNKRMLVVGITVGVLGFALGNYLGIAVYYLISGL